MNGHSSHQASTNRSSLQGKVAIITGGASGFGATTARLFVSNGAKVVIADVQDKLGKSLCDELNLSKLEQEASIAVDAAISYVHCDVTKDSEVRHLIDATVSAHGRLDIMFNNAGIPGNLDFNILNSDEANFKRVMEVNVFGSFLGAKHAARVMIPKKSGVILFTSSLASVTSGESPHSYAASKHAVVGLMKNLSVELGGHGVRVNAISPCAVATPLLTASMGAPREVVEGIITDSAVLKGVVPTEDDVAEAALWLASDGARFVSGVNLVVDGGYSLTNQSYTRAFNTVFFSPKE